MILVLDKILDGIVHFRYQEKSFVGIMPTDEKAWEFLSEIGKAVVEHMVCYGGQPFEREEPADFYWYNESGGTTTERFLDYFEGKLRCGETEGEIWPLEEWQTMENYKALFNA